ncbi:MAG TPA: ribonuclease HI family protein [Candidatus Bathyarchaeia archaeon]|nr:ribonuclease HI family protein [Candidatus Bathyarchaeia archaeon]
MIDYKIYTDGGARGNPGPAGIGFVIFDSQGKVIVKAGKFIGKATNNMAEYLAVVESLKWLKKQVLDYTNIPSVRINIYCDSMLIVNQLNGIYKIKNIQLKHQVIKIRVLENAMAVKVLYHYIPREKNIIADQLVNCAIKKAQN